MNGDCAFVDERLEGFAEGRSGRFESERIRRHLAGCPSCRAALEAERRLRRDLPGLPKLRCPEGVSDSILAAVDGPERRAAKRRVRSPGPKAWFWKPAFAAVLILALAAGFWDRSRRTSNREHAYSEAELKLADAALKWSLAYAAGTLRQAEKKALETVTPLPRSGPRPAGVQSGGDGK
jgi:predicted anti-sigma-YlaC factor YlaD